jgi:hypothetical protein
VIFLKKTTKFNFHIPRNLFPYEKTPSLSTPPNLNHASQTMAHHP